MAHSITITLDTATLTTSVATELYKWGEVNKDDANYKRIYNLQYGVNDNVDKALVKQFLKQRANRIADIVSEYLTEILFGSEVNPIGPNNPEQNPFEPAQPTTEPNYVVFSMTLPEGWNLKTYDNLVKLFEDYCIDGAAADWFAEAGVNQAGVFGDRAAQHALGITKNIYNKNSTI